MDIESLWYEISPYLYAAFGVGAVFYGPGSILLKGSGILLIAAALTIVRLRWVYRRALFREVQSAADFSKESREKSQGLLLEEEQMRG